MFTIGEVAERSGVPEGTLRMWERRHGFPAPRRLPSGHRRYSEDDVELVRRVADGRAAGLTLVGAIERAREPHERPAVSIFAALRRRRPDIAPRTLAKPVMIALSHAIEDESLARAERPLLFAAFQRERFYRQAEKRWQAFARQAEPAIVFADFPEVKTPRGGPIEIPLERDHALSREWAVVCQAPGHAACLVGWEPPGSGQRGRRFFEVIWSVEPEVVREASRICAALAAGRVPELVAPVLSRLAAEADPPAVDQLRLATAVTSRVLSYLEPAAPGAG